MIIDASKMNSHGYTKGSVIGAAVSAVHDLGDVNSIKVDKMYAETGRVVEIDVAREIILEAGKDMGIELNVDVDCSDGWSQFLVVSLRY